MGAIATFDYASWVTLFPEFSYLAEEQLTAYYDLAGQFHANDGSGPVCRPASQANLMNLMTAHLCALMAGGPPDQSGNAQPPREIVGRIGNATEGSVSVGIDNNYPPGSAQWYQQTKYGSMYYMATGPYRTMRYIPGRLAARPGMGPAWQYPSSTTWPWPW